ncbi:MAG: sulfur carrier protein ThiS [Salinisphaera sp.]|nr:sulfur carrier protein ThiS [Salinisphaera sp.]
MEIRLNGNTHTLPHASSLAQLISDLGLDGRRLAVEVNGEIVPGSARGEHGLAEGDRVEIVHAIGGGAPCRPSRVARHD